MLDVSKWKKPNREIGLLLSSLFLDEFHSHGDGVAASEAECGDATLGVALLHLVHKGDENARTGAADRMT
jgi:hypothetical protein